VFAGILVMSAIYTVFNEGPDNWQSLWSCAVFALFGITLWRARAAQSQEPAVQ
ncbi:MAG: ndvC, partial [Tardiphaga sp.]|nr:ndvC [Tardiphaga sp.]